MHEVYQKSLEEFKETEAKFSISTLNCIHSKLHLVDLPVGWVILSTKFCYHPFS